MTASASQIIPHQFIADRLKDGLVIPFLGSWASIAGLPLDLRPPDGRGLAEGLQKQIPHPLDDGATLTKVSQIFEDCVAGRRPLYDYLRRVFYPRPDGLPCVVRLLSEISAIRLILTTNYDPYVELAHQRARRPYAVLTHITNPRNKAFPRLWRQDSCFDSLDDDAISKETGILLSKGELVDADGLDLQQFGSRTVIYKMHGTFSDQLTAEHDTIVITENDYADFLVRSPNLPPAIMRGLWENHVLYLGYSLEDWNFRVALRKLQDERPAGLDLKSWAVQRHVSPVDSKIWQKRGVEVYDTDLDDFITEIRRCL